MVLLPNFVNIRLYFFNNENLSFFSGAENFFLVVPSMFCNLSIFGKFSYILQRFKCVLFDFVEFNGSGSTKTDEMAVLRADCKLLYVFDSKVAFS